ncbi:MAG: GAF domain-containing protein, partial [Defluviitaleaceae bacterium]|nr:GAF domain-containing protein [Defluviitaleaceae bacterium]
MIILVIIVVVMAIVALAVLGVVIYKLNLRIAMLDAESREANAGYIGLMQEREHQIILMQTVDAIAFKLLGMPDNDLEKFDSFLLEGMHEVSIFGELDAIRVYRNEPYGDDMKYVMQLSWEDGFTPDTSETGESYLYSKLPGWFERLDTMEPINTVVSALTEAEQDFIGTQAKSLLVMPVVFQERFWGTVWYEDFHNVEPFDQKRVALLRSAALMIISAVHRKRQVNRIREATRRTRLMLDAMPMCCFVWDSNFNMIEANEMGWKFFGFKDKEELMARFHDTNPLCQLDGERSEETRCKNIQRALEEGTYNFEWMHIIPSTGERVPSEVSLVRMLYDGKHVVAAYVRDVREQTQMMQEIKYRGDLLETVNRAANVLLQSSTEDFESALFRTLSMIARSVRVERIFVWEQKEHDGAQLFQELYEWVGDATMIHKPDRLIEFAGELSSFTVRFARGVNPSGLTRDLPEDVQDTLGLIDTKSYLIIPIFLRPSVIWGLIGFCDLRVERGFS